MQLAIKIQNLDKVRAALNKSPQVFAKHVDNAIKKSVFEIQRNAQSLVPVDTSNLHLAILRDVVYQPLRAVIEPSKSAGYAYWVEILDRNSHKVGQAHYFEKGVKQSEREVNQYFEKAVEDGLEEISQKAN